MKFTRTTIPDVILVEPRVFGDARGFFMETYQARLFAEAGIPNNFVQDNHSSSAQGILRGIHYQIHQPQGKLVRVAVGKVFDAAVDLRRGSPTFGKWVGFELSAENKCMLWVPPGFGHAFYVMSEQADFLYKATDYYAPEWERSIAWNDPDLAIEWPLVNGQPPLLSSRDSKATPFRDAEVYEPGSGH